MAVRTVGEDGICMNAERNGRRWDENFSGWRNGGMG
jgi:hypothetical protein